MVYPPPVNGPKDCPIIRPKKGPENEKKKRSKKIVQKNCPIVQGSNGPIYILPYAVNKPVLSDCFTNTLPEQ